ncbi:multi-copper oxidase [Stereum hirsutum FP-91666 SS1]|uniref:multi-copper oxidase n=1 Tax=Stereum hirsutum (strain FP-91666) TaxID=721885 RepID=UPI000440DEB0|nr:multi-copper oxidase [Stereum hirsutum FP-91666 SS1]EIM90555.1 multi-copper oxidase [Stereum hirsutum FP-91666 SS1]
MLALEFGLDLGLRHDIGSSLENDAQNSVVSLDQLVNSSQFTLDPSFSVSSIPTTRYYNWTVSLVNAAPVGIVKPMVVINGMSPGPVIEANSGDRIIVRVNNDMSNESTTIHWHGLYQNGTSWMDGTNAISQCGIPPGETMTYNFTLEDWVGTTWYHAHCSTMYSDGLVGPIVVYSPNETVPSSDQDLIVQLSDIYNTWSPTLLSGYLSNNDIEVASEPVPDAGTINGIGQFTDCAAYADQPCDGHGSYFNFTLAANKTYRLRLINSGSFAPIRFSVDSHVLTVIEADGTPVEPLKVSSVSLQVAQRYSVLLRTNQTADAYWMRAVLDESMFAYTNHALHGTILGVVRYDGVPNGMMPNSSLASSNPGTGTSASDLDTSRLVPADAIDAPSTASISIPWTFSIQRTWNQNWRSFINLTSWEPLGSGQATLISATAVNASTGVQSFDGDQLITTFEDIQVVDFVINNLDDGDHPFHLHGYKPWIMGSGVGRYIGTPLNSTNPMRRDTFLVPAFSWIVVRIITDNPGYWAFHCHVAWHMAAGGLFQVAVQPSKLKSSTFPDDIVQQCTAALTNGITTVG